MNINLSYMYKVSIVYICLIFSYLKRYITSILKRVVYSTSLIKNFEEYSLTGPREISGWLLGKFKAVKVRLDLSTYK